MPSSRKSGGSSPLQAALEQAFPGVSLTVMDQGDRILVKVDTLTFSTPHSLNAQVEPWQYWLSRFTTQIRQKLPYSVA